MVRCSTPSKRHVLLFHLFPAYSVQPRIRQITGIRIHQLTLPESLAYASKLVAEPLSTIQDGITSAGPSSSPIIHDSSPFTSPHLGDDRSRRERGLSSSTVVEYSRDRSMSSSAAPLSPVPRGPRGTRPRAPTLAGEAISHAQEGSAEEGTGAEVSKPVTKRPLARCFVVLKLPALPHLNATSGSNEPKRTRGGDEHLHKETNGKHAASRPYSSRTSSATSISSPPSPRPRLISTPSRSSMNPPSSETPGRIRTHSLTSPPSRTNKRPGSSGTALHRTLSGRGPSSRHGAEQRPTISTRSYSAQSGQSLSSPLSSPMTPTAPRTIVPFYISPIHHPSTYPRFLSLAPDTDFAPWITVDEAASHRVHLEVWYEDDGWKIFNGISGEIDLGQLRKLEKDTKLPGNTIQFMLSSDSKDIYYLPPPQTEQNDHSPVEDEAVQGRTPRQNVRGVVERSIRETRMKKGVGIGGLHQ